MPTADRRPSTADRDYWSKLVRSCLLWADDGLSRPTRLHDSTCAVEDGECSCRTPEDQLVAGSLVVQIEERGLASLVSVAGHLPVWIESDAVERTQISLGETPSASSVPADYLEWVASADQPGPKKRVRASPRGGALVFVRADESREPWRWLGHVHHEGKRAALLVDPVVPVSDVLDVRPDQVRVVPLDGREARNVLVPVLLASSSELPASSSTKIRRSRR